MYARNVSISLKPNTASEFTQTLETEILPILRKQSGFLDEITLLDANGKDAIAISLWDRKDSADAYSRDTYALVLKGLSKVVDGTPEVHAYQVANSTYHQIAAHN
jgi:ribosomal protein S8